MDRMGPMGPMGLIGLICRKTATQEQRRDRRDRRERPITNHNNQSLSPVRRARCLLRAGQSPRFRVARIELPRHSFLSLLTSHISHLTSRFSPPITFHHSLFTSHQQPPQPGHRPRKHCPVVERPCEHQRTLDHSKRFFGERVSGRLILPGPNQSCR